MTKEVGLMAKIPTRRHSAIESLGGILEVPAVEVKPPISKSRGIETGPSAPKAHVVVIEGLTGKVREATNKSLDALVEGLLKKAKKRSR